MKKITFLLLTVFTGVLSAQTVNIQGDPHSGNPYASITAAITAATDGDVILITGTHTLTGAPLSISKSITLRGTDPTTDIIQAAGSEIKDGSGSRVINIGAGSHTITIENLGIKHGNFTENGGGINIDKVSGQVTLNNLIIENNYSVKNGGGLGIAGSNVDIINCTIQNNSSVLDGGGFIAAPNNSTVDCIVNIKQSLISSNTGRIGGGFYINGNHDFGDKYTITTNFENVTIFSNNATTSGGAGHTFGVDFVAGGSNSITVGDTNTSVNMVHCTVAYNTSADANRMGLTFGKGAATTGPNFGLYNSIVVSDNDTANRAINFTDLNSIATDPLKIINCILGGLGNTTAALLTYIDANNNLRGRTATFAGLTNTLTDEGGKTKVLAIGVGSNSDDYCTASTGITIPTVDQRGYTREGVNDAGAFEFGGTLGLGDEILKNSAVRIFPNPAQNILNIQSLNAVTRAEIYDITGKRVFQSNKIHKNSIDVSNLKAGLYAIRIEDVNNNFSTKKLIISR